MPKIAYEVKSFRAAAMATIVQAEAICEEYSRQGYTLTLRQLYYQFVSRDLIANNQKEYDRLGIIVTEARLAGLIDWNHLADRTRSTQRVSMWDSPADMIYSAYASYRGQVWSDQDYHVEVWVEKEALQEVIARPANRFRVPHFCCRGYVSASSMYESAQRLIAAARNGKTLRIIHLGDHDPSGIDMSRDIMDRLALMVEHHGQQRPEVVRIALNMDQVEQYSPPPNPTKMSDSRAHGPNGYVARFGDESWELDALEPRVLDALIETAITEVMDMPAFERAKAQEKVEQAQLRAAWTHWSDVALFVDQWLPESQRAVQQEVEEDEVEEEEDANA